MAKSKYENYTKEQLLEKIKHLEKHRYGLIWEDKQEDVAEQCDRELPVLHEDASREIKSKDGLPPNILIEGDNYHSLYSLSFTHKKNIDLIYIDPPFNTGAKNWKYNNHFVDANDPYRHSKWLSFMNKRLRIAKTLLKNDGSLICAIDKNEQSQLGMLLEKVFPSHEKHCITIVHNPRGVQGNNFSYTHEYAYFVIPSGKKIVEKRKIADDDIEWNNLRNWGSESLREDAKNCFYPIFINPKTKEIVRFGDVSPKTFHPKLANIADGDLIQVYPLDKNKAERKWRYARQSVEQIRHLLRARKKNKLWDIEIGKDFGIYKTVWLDPRYDANEYGTKIVKELVPSSDFDFPKSLYTVFDCLYAIVGDKKNSIVLDYFAGSGTTGHAVLELNDKDRGKRQFILCTNNEVGEAKEIEFKNKYNIGAKEFADWKKEGRKEWKEWCDLYGICSSVTYPRIKKVIKGYNGNKPIFANLKYFKAEFVPQVITDNDKRVLVNRSTELLCLAENTFELVKQSKRKVEFAIYRNQKQLTAIIYDEDAIEKCKEELEALKPKGKTVIYVFSYDHEYNIEDFDDLTIRFDVKPIPEAILNVYRKISKLRRK